MFGLGTLWKGIKVVATGRTQQSLGLQSGVLPGALVRLGRFGYISSGAWLGAVWYTGYVNMHTPTGSGPKLVLPGTKVINSPDRPDPTAAWSRVNPSGGILGGGAFSTNPGPGGERNPFPGGRGSRLDQGFDLTSNSFLAPADSVIVLADRSNAGWAGGGMVSGKILSGPKAGRVWYMAEGLTPTVRVGQQVKAGTPVATPRANPYNGVVGNIEAGWANPRSPSQPLAQVSGNKPSVAWDFYRWIRSLGGPTATSTGNAGYA